MDRFEVSIELGNDDMSTPADVAWALHKIVHKLSNMFKFPDKFQNVHDINGNRVGTYGIRKEGE